MRQNYEVIRFVQQNGRYHIVMDNVEGQLLSSFIVQNPVLDKNRFWKIIASLAKEIDCLRHCNGKELVPIVTPYHIVVKNEGEIALLRHQNKPEIIEGYTYDFGKTIQFMLVKMKLEPRMTWKESIKLKRIIAKCIKKKKEIPWIKRILILCVLGAGLFIQYKPLDSEETPSQILQSYLENQAKVQEEDVFTASLAYEEGMATSASLLDYVFLLQVYTKLGNEDAKKQILTYGKKVMNELVKNRELIAEIYMEQGEIELARKEYEILVTESPSEERYLALAALEEKCGELKEALNICEKGSLVYPECMELHLQYVRLLLSDLEDSMENKKEKLEVFLTLYPGLRDEERFNKLLTEFGYQMEEQNEV